MAANLTHDIGPGVAQICPSGCGCTSAVGGDEAHHRLESRWALARPRLRCFHYDHLPPVCAKGMIQMGAAWPIWVVSTKLPRRGE
jgi:hypothetical protein